MNFRTFFHYRGCFQGDIPSASPLIPGLLGRFVVTITRYSQASPEVVCKDTPNNRDKAFSLSLGTIHIKLDDGRIIGVDGDGKRCSVIIWAERDDQGRERELELPELVANARFFPISISDREYSPPSLQRVVGQQIRSVRIYKVRPFDERSKTLAREAILEVEFESRDTIFFCYGLAQFANSSFCVVSKNDLDPSTFKEFDIYKEII
ncbi:hypothetical protein [Fimbriiglobus ruber]|uniref:hypothetical protein n=1 Tax=Fimbriiglobus ruber TaxID=1908690 RepID=UPI00117BD654|nr:hypothetical protein [Fimbriiglobus ruber]